MTNAELATEIIDDLVLSNYRQLKLYRGVAEMKDVSINERFIYTYIQLSDLDPTNFRGTDVYVKGLGIPKITFNLAIQRLIERGWVKKEKKGIYSLVPTQIF